MATKLKDAPNLRVIRTVLSKDEARAIERLAKRDGLSTSRWMRRILVEVMRGRLAATA